MRSIVWLTLVGIALGTAPVMAAPPPPPADKPAPPPPLAPTSEADLKSGDPAKVRAALDDVRMGGKANARLAPVIADLLQRGLPLSVSEAAINTLGDLQSDAASPVLASYAQYRTTKIRQAAIKALLKTKGAPAVRSFRRGLSDPDPMIRGLSATGLGALKAKEALPDLSVALDHRVDEAAVAIGQLCGAPECEALAARIGRLPLDVVTGGLDQALFRPDVPEDTKIKFIGKLRELGTAEANKYLKDVLKRGATLSPRLKQAVDQAVQATPGGGAL
jgi:hypothetical protein